MHREKSTTIYDIANIAKASPSTVSRVLTNSSHPVNADVRERILSAARELNYIPNAQARFLKTKNNPSIGIIIPSIDNPFYPSIVRGMADAAVDCNYSIYLSNCDREYELTDRQINNMLELNVQGIISVYLDTMTPRLKSFVDRGGKLVSLVSKNTEINEGVYTVRVDKNRETEIAMEHLLGLGHKKIACFIDEINCQLRMDKLGSYRETLRCHGIDPCEDYVYIYGRDLCVGDHSKKTDAERAGSFVEAFLKRSPDCSAILCMNDIMALGVCAALRSWNYSVPDDFSVMGYDDSFFSPYCYPSLTTVALDKYAWGQRLMRYMLDIIAGKEGLAKTVESDALLNPVYLVERKSTIAAKARI